jgi:hypothetical protein
LYFVSNGDQKTMPKMKINDLDYYYELHGEWPPLVFVHGGFVGWGAAEALDLSENLGQQELIGYTSWVLAKALAR